MVGKTPFGALTFILLSAGEIDAQERGQAGFGQISTMAGWRSTPNDVFLRNAASMGLEAQNLWEGGPIGGASFGYAASDWLEISVDFLAGAEQFSGLGATALSSVTYGALVGVRAYVPWAGGTWVPSVGLLAGPTLVLVSGAQLPKPSEVLETAYAATVGVRWWAWGQTGLTVDYKFLWVRGQVPELGGINGGGNWLSLGVCWLFPPETPL